VLPIPQPDSDNIRTSPSSRYRFPVPAEARPPKFSVTSATAIDRPQSVTVTHTQSNTPKVSLNFATRTWPHVLVATLVPAEPIELALP
jgi:hypothetical protein